MQVGDRAQTTWTDAGTASTAGSAVTTTVPPTGATLTHWALFTAATGGVLLYSDNLRKADGTVTTEPMPNGGTYTLTPTLTAAN